MQLAAAKVIPFAGSRRRRRFGLRGLGDDFTSMIPSGYTEGSTPSDVYNAVLANTGDAAAAANAAATLANQTAAMANAGLPAWNPVAPASVAPAGTNFNVASLLPFAQLGLQAYGTSVSGDVASKQTAVGIAPPGYTYRGYASNLTSSYGNIAPPGYSYNSYGQMIPMGSGGGMSYVSPTASAGISSTTLLLLLGLGAVLMMGRRNEPARR